MGEFGFTRFDKMPLWGFHPIGPLQWPSRKARERRFDTGEDEEMPLIESGTISSPVEYLDLDLPSGYSGYYLIFSGIEIDTEDSLGAVVSVDGGATWISDQEVFDTYRTQSHGVGTAGGDTTGMAEGTTDGQLFLLFNPADSTVDRAANIEAFITPGKAGKSFTITIRSTAELAQQTGSLRTSCCFYNIQADVPVVAATINAIRILPYGNGDVDPPTSEETITGGSYFLYGIPTP